MATSLEDIVRPFTQDGEVLPKPGPISIPAVVPPVQIIAGGSGSGKIIPGSSDLEETFYIVKKPQELTDEGDALIVAGGGG